MEAEKGNEAISVGLKLIEKKLSYFDRASNDLSGTCAAIYESRWPSLIYEPEALTGAKFASARSFVNVWSLTSSDDSEL